MTNTTLAQAAMAADAELSKFTDLIDQEQIALDMARVVIQALIDNVSPHMIVAGVATSPDASGVRDIFKAMLTAVLDSEGGE